MIPALLLTPLILGLAALLLRRRLLNLWILGLGSVSYGALALGLVWGGAGRACTPYFALDGLNVFFLLIMALLFPAVGLRSLDYLRRTKLSLPWQTYYTAFLLWFVFAMTGVLLSTHLGLVWVFVEATTLTSVVFIYLDKTRESLEATWKYLFICSIGIALAFVGIILLIAAFKGQETSLFFADIVRRSSELDRFWLKLAFLFILVGFGTKAGLAPVHSWLPDAHSQAPSAVSGLLSGALLNCALLAVLRLLPVVDRTELDAAAGSLLVVMGLLSVLICAVFIVRSRDFKRLLAYSSIENMGIAVLAFGVGGYTAGLLQLFAHSLAKASFFLTAGNVYEERHTRRIDDVRNLLSSSPATAWLWLLCALAVAGFPPFPSFLAKVMVFARLVRDERWFVVVFWGALLAVILYGLVSMAVKMSLGTAKPVTAPAPASSKAPDSVPGGALCYVPQFILLGVLLYVGVLMPGWFKEMLQNASGILQP